MISDRSIHTVTLAIPDGKMLDIIDKRPQVRRPNFYMMGNNTMNRDGIQSVDLIMEAATLSRPAIVTLSWIRQAIVWDNRDGVVKFSMSDLTDAQEQQFKKGFKELNDRNLVRRVKRSHYMINPNALIPIDYEAALQIWNSIGETK